MSEIVVAIVAGVVTIIVTLLGLIGAKKYNIGPNQEQAIMTYKEVINAQNLRIDQLEEENKTLASQLAGLSKQVDDLTKLTINQAIKISVLEGKIKGGQND